MEGVSTEGKEFRVSKGQGIWRSWNVQLYSLEGSNQMLDGPNSAPSKSELRSDELVFQVSMICIGLSQYVLNKFQLNIYKCESIHHTERLAAALVQFCPSDL